MSPQLNHDEIYTFKLLSGEEIVARLVCKYADHYEIKQPISMVLGPQGLQMMPSLFSSNPDKNTLINMHSIAMASEPRMDVRDKYVEATTGIAVPGSKQIITG